MKTFAKFVLNDDSPVFMRNLIPALFLTFAVICVVTSIGAFLAWASTPNLDSAPFKIYIYLGLVMLGLVNGVSTIIGIFVALMKVQTK